MKHLISLPELQPGDLAEILNCTADLKVEFARGERPPLLRNRVLTQIFEKPSLRTRVSFEAAVIQLGGSSIFLTSAEAGLEGRESLPDVARVVSSYSDVIVTRTFSQAAIAEIARNSSCPVINGLSDGRHPCQALTDVFTLKEVFGDVEGRRFVFIGDGNNVATSLAIASAMLEMPMTICTPPEYVLKEEVLADLRRQFPNADITTTTKPQQAVEQADVVYTDVWASMGQESEAKERQQIFAPYQVNAELMAHAPAECRFMHCLPARRGTEVTDEVIDGPQSLVFLQAENRMHLAKGLIVWLLDAR